MLILAAPKPMTAADLRIAFGDNLVTGRDSLIRAFGDCTSLEEDILHVLSALYAADLAIKRQPREQFLRSLEIHISVINYHVLNHHRATLEHLLYLLTQDNWTIRFQRQPGTPEANAHWMEGRGRTLLFSGGLDSFCAAAEMAKDTSLYLVSHTTFNQVVSRAQQQLHSAIESRLKVRIPRIVARVSPRTRPRYPFPTDQDREDTQRSRSLLFLGLASLVARRTGHSEVVTIAENGQMALHLPLTNARIAAFSTHTADPEFVARAQEFFSSALSYPLKFLNPYLYLTKVEVVNRLPRVLRSVIPQSVSCWRASRVPSKNHCGECVPCLVRRIALESNGISLAEYSHDLFREDVGNLPPDNLGKRNLIELMMFIVRFESLAATDQLGVQEQFPELINTHIDLAAAIQMYRRFAVEARKVFDNYPALRTLLR